MADLYAGMNARISAVFQDINEQLVDPTSVVLRVKDPLSAVTTPVTTRASQGVFYSDVLLSRAGVWFYRWEATIVDGGHTYLSIGEGEVSVKTSNVV